MSQQCEGGSCIPCQWMVACADEEDCFSTLRGRQCLLGLWCVSFHAMKCVSVVEVKVAMFHSDCRQNGLTATCTHGLMDHADDWSSVGDADASHCGTHGNTGQFMIAVPEMLVSQQCVGLPARQASLLDGLLLLPVDRCNVREQLVIICAPPCTEIGVAGRCNQG